MASDAPTLNDLVEPTYLREIKVALEERAARLRVRANHHDNFIAGLASFELAAVTKTLEAFS